MYNRCHGVLEIDIVPQVISTCMYIVVVAALDPMVLPVETTKAHKQSCFIKFLVVRQQLPNNPHTHTAIQVLGTYYVDTPTCFAIARSLYLSVAKTS